MIEELRVPLSGTDIQNNVNDSNDGVKDTDNTFLYRFGNMQGIGARENQEDAFAFSDVFDSETVKTRGALAVVADGMGGLQGGKTASETAVSIVRQGFSTLNMEVNIAEQLNAVINRAGREVEKAVNGKGGCTVIAVVIYQNNLYYSSLGDSYLYLKRGEYLVRLNRFHTVMTDALAELIEDGLMNPEEVVIHDNPAALTEFLGKNPQGKIDCFAKPFRLRYGDVLLLCTDGVGGTLNEQQLYKALSEETPYSMCASMEESIVSLRKRYQDNYTALVIQCTYP